LATRCIGSQNPFAGNHKAAGEFLPMLNLFYLR
jgi:hypothetical protein